MNKSTMILSRQLEALQNESIRIYKDGFIKGSWKDDETAQEFYALHREAWELKDKISVIRAKNKEITHFSEHQLMVKKAEQRERLITSTTYERAQKRLFKEVDQWVGRA